VQPDVGQPSTLATGHLLAMAARMVEHAWAAQLAQHGVTMAGLMVLHSLQDGALTQRQVAERCGVTDQTTSRTVDRLTRDGLVRRTRGRRDRRAVHVTLTPEGQAVYEATLALAADERPLLGLAVDVPALRAQLLAIVAHHSEGAAAGAVARPGVGGAAGDGRAAPTAG